MDKDTVDFVPNYDETGTEPTVLPAAFPNLLVNGGTGIAVGMATNMPPHNLGEVIDAICAQIDNPDITVDELMAIRQGPRLPHRLHHLRRRRHPQLPRDRPRQRQGARPRSASRNSRAETASRSSSPRSPTTSTAPPSSSASPSWSTRRSSPRSARSATSRTRTPASSSTSSATPARRSSSTTSTSTPAGEHRSPSTCWPSTTGRPKPPQPQGRSSPATSSTAARSSSAAPATSSARPKSAPRDSRRFLIASRTSTSSSRSIRESANREEAFEQDQGLRIHPRRGREHRHPHPRPGERPDGECYLLTDSQVNHILELRLYQLTGLEQRQDQGRTTTRVLEEIKDLLDILANEERVLQIIKDELGEIKEKYATPRLTDIDARRGRDQHRRPHRQRGLASSPSPTAASSSAPPPANTAPRSAAARACNGMDTRESQPTDEDEDDFVEHLFTASAHDYLMFFTNTGRVYVERVYSDPRRPRAAKGRSHQEPPQPPARGANCRRAPRRARPRRGRPAPPSTSRITSSSPPAPARCKKTKLTDFRNYRKDGIIAIKHRGGQRAHRRQAHHRRATTICLITSDGYCVRTNEDTIRPMGRTSAGVRGIRPREEDRLVAFVVPDGGQASSSPARTASANAPPSRNIMTKGRGGKGMNTMKVTAKTGKVVGALAVHEEDDIMLMTNGGQSASASPPAQIRSIGRATQGVTHHVASKRANSSKTSPASSPTRMTKTTATPRKTEPPNPKRPKRPPRNRGLRRESQPAASLTPIPPKPRPGRDLLSLFLSAIHPV